ncbi:rho GTPase-activating protein 24 isoform X2 [Syngnathoides biaculeatus]|uniref:rho GTPase-activating protein 24 isoform X2 n=1 Tax=Syngnathoides biaculeatus TaxID=300417 RepID=UPI002ADE85D5|nr:rho GTPase-activating protein 24 isoform X2 [Syngnathoides biaculeatus]
MDEQSHGSPQHGGFKTGVEAHQGRQGVIKCGWLRKQGGFVKTWHNRWFVLRGDQLFYYKDEDESKSLGAIFLPGNKVTEHPSSGDEAGKYLFEVLPGGDRERMTTNHETYLLMASTQNDMEDWVKTIRRVIWAPFGGGIFGQKLEETVRYERRYGNKMAPMLVEQCADFIRQRGLLEEGLFRLPGQANLVKELQEAFDCGEKPLFDCNTDVHTVASLLKLYLRELPEPVVPFHKYDDFLACTKLLSKDDDETGMRELRKLVEGLPPVNYNLLKYICRFLDEVQSYSGVNKMSVQNLATVFGPNILRPKVEDPVTIMEGTVLVQQLMAVLIGRHDTVFPREQDSPAGPAEIANNNNMDSPRQPAAQTMVAQNVENNNIQAVRQCVWEALDSPCRHEDRQGSPRSASPRNIPGCFDNSRSPPLTVKKNPAFSKGSGIVTNGSFSSSPPSLDPNLDKCQILMSNGSLPGRRNGTLKGSGTKMGTSGVTGSGNTNGVLRMGVSGPDAMAAVLNGHSGLWVPNGCVTLREANKGLREYPNGDPSCNQNRLSTSCEDKQSVDSATWSTSSCEISLPDNTTSCRSSTTTCPEQDFYGCHYQDLDGPNQDGGGDEGRESGREALQTDEVARNCNEHGGKDDAGEGHSALHSLVVSLKQEMLKQKSEYEARIKSLDQRNLDLESKMVSLHEELDQERKKYTMAEIKLRNAERAKDDAERRNHMLQKEMEQFFSTFSDLTATGSSSATVDPRRPDRGNPIWIQ